MAEAGDFFPMARRRQLGQIRSVGGDSSVGNGSATSRRVQGIGLGGQGRWRLTIRSSWWWRVSAEEENWRRCGQMVADGYSRSERIHGGWRGAHWSGGMARGGRKMAGNVELPMAREATGMGGRVVALAGSSTRWRARGVGARAPCSWVMATAAVARPSGLAMIRYRPRIRAVGGKQVGFDLATASSHVGRNLKSNLS
jgi:hypothetical protein